jgi:hypothetical protein
MDETLKTKLMLMKKNVVGVRNARR